MSSKIKLPKYDIIDLTDEQIFVIQDIESWWIRDNEQLYQYSGPAGSGKTTILTKAIERIGLKLDHIAFVAYSGKAASVLTQHGLPGKTIHSLIYDYREVRVTDEKGHIMLDSKGRPKVKSKFVLKNSLDPKIKLIVVDEASMVDLNLGRDLMSFGIRVIALGDLNQLPPVFGDPYFLYKPNAILTKVMRQTSDNPIIRLSQMALHHGFVEPGIYGDSAVIDLDPDKWGEVIRYADCILTYTNQLREEVNRFYRAAVMGYRHLNVPNIGEKLVCRKNNWNENIGKEIFLTNGTVGIVTNLYNGSFNGHTIKLDFRPDYTTREFKKLKVNYKRLQGIEMSEKEEYYARFDSQFEYGYALTVHSSQGSEYDYVVLIDDYRKKNDPEYRNWLYTAITRAKKRIVIIRT